MIAVENAEKSTGAAHTLDVVLRELEAYISHLDDNSSQKTLLTNYGRQARIYWNNRAADVPPQLAEMACRVLFYVINPANLEATPRCIALIMSNINNSPDPASCYQALAILSADATTAVTLLVNRNHESQPEIKETRDEKRRRENRRDLNRALADLLVYVQLLDNNDPQKQILEIYIEQAKEDLKTMPVENLPTLTRLTYRVLIHAIDPSNKKNNQAGAALALDIAKMNKKSYAGHLALVILSGLLIITTVSAAVLILLASSTIAAPLAAVIAITVAVSLWLIRKSVLRAERSITALRSTEDSAAARHMVNCGFFAPPTTPSASIATSAKTPGNSSVSLIDPVGENSNSNTPLLNK